MHVRTYPSPSLGIGFLQHAAETAVKRRDANEHQKQCECKHGAVAQQLLDKQMNGCWLMYFYFHGFAIQQ